MIRILSNIFRTPAVLVAVGLVLFSYRADAQQIGVKTNALMWTMFTPNVGCEVVVGERSSLDFSLFGHDRPLGVDSQLFAIQPEYRYWFNGRPMIREFVGATLMAADYAMTISNRCYDGYALSAGLIGGYSFSLGVDWRLELSGGLALLFFNHKQHYAHDNYDDYFIEEPVRANAWGYKLFPAKIGVTFTYIIK